MDIDLYIRNIDDSKLIGNGSNKKCFDFGDVVLLKYSCSDDYVESEFNNIIGVKEKLDGNPVNAYKILDYKFDNGFFYVLESKVNGYPIQEYKRNSMYEFDSVDEAVLYYNLSRVSVLKYIERLKQLNNISILDKFFSDYVAIMKSGIVVDPSKTSNFLFDGKKVSFIDLNCHDNASSYGVNDIVYYMMYVISWSSSLDASMDEILEISFYLESIYKKIISISDFYGYKLGITSFGKTCDDLISSKIDSFVSYSKSIDDYKKMVKMNTK